MRVTADHDSEPHQQPHPRDNAQSDMGLNYEGTYLMTQRIRPLFCFLHVSTASVSVSCNTPEPYSRGGDQERGALLWPSWASQDAVC
jgi:hypothetical protein